MNDIYDVAILGATVFGCGYVVSAAQQGLHCLLADAQSQPAWDYAAALRGTGDEVSFTPALPESAALKEELLCRGVLEADCGPHLPALEPVICRTLTDLPGTDFLFCAQVTEITQTDGIFTLRFFTTGGFVSVRAKKVVETHSGKPLRRYLGANLLVPPDAVRTGADLIPGRFDTECFWRVEVPLSADWTQARHILHDAWQHRPGERKSWTLLQPCICFWEETAPIAEQVAPGHIRLPGRSETHRSFFHAYEAGLQAAKDEGVPV